MCLTERGDLRLKLRDLHIAIICHQTHPGYAALLGGGARIARSFDERL
jgi:hypothetical protein